MIFEDKKMLKINVCGQNILIEQPLNFDDLKPLVQSKMNMKNDMYFYMKTVRNTMYKESTTINILSTEELNQYKYFLKVNLNITDEIPLICKVVDDSKLGQLIKFFNESCVAASIEEIETNIDSYYDLFVKMKFLNISDHEYNNLSYPKQYRMMVLKVLMIYNLDIPLIKKIRESKIAYSLSIKDLEEKLLKLNDKHSNVKTNQILAMFYKKLNRNKESNIYISRAFVKDPCCKSAFSLFQMYANNKNQKKAYEMAIILVRMNCFVGYIHLGGHYSTISRRKASMFFEKAILLGSVDAIYYNAYSLCFYNGGLYDGGFYELAEKKFKESIKYGNIKALTDLAIYYKTIPKNIRLFLKCATEASDKYNCVNANIQLFQYYCSIKQYQNAKKYINRSISIGSGRAAYCLAEFYKKDGNDKKKMLFYYNLSYKYGSSDGCLQLARCYKNESASLHKSYLVSAAEMKNMKAIFEIISSVFRDRGLDSAKTVLDIYSEQSDYHILDMMKYLLYKKVKYLHLSIKKGSPRGYSILGVKYKIKGNIKEYYKHLILGILNQDKKCLELIDSNINPIDKLKIQRYEEMKNNYYDYNLRYFTVLYHFIYSYDSAIKYLKRYCRVVGCDIFKYKEYNDYTEKISQKNIYNNRNYLDTRFSFNT